MYNLLIGGAAGQGVDTTANVLEKLMKKSGYHVFTARDFMSRIRNGHNFSLVRFGPQPVRSHSLRLDGIVALDEETAALHADQLSPEGFILCDSGLAVDDPRAIRIDMQQIAKEIGNPRVAGSIAVGAVLKLFGETLAHVEKVFASSLAEKYIAINLKAVAAGYERVEQRFSPKAGQYADRMILSGSTAVTLGAQAAGSGRIVFSMTPFGREIRQIPAGVKAAVYCVNMGCESVLAKGTYRGVRRGIIPAGVFDVEKVYNSMLPKAGYIYPKPDLTPVTDWS